MLHIYIYDISRLRVKNEWRCTSTPSVRRRAVFKDNFVITLLLMYSVKALVVLCPTTLTRARKNTRQVPSPVAVNIKHVVRFEFQKSLTSSLTHLRASRSSRTTRVSPSWLCPSSPILAPAALIFALQSQKYNNIFCFLLGNSPPSEFYMPTFRNTLSVPSS